MLALGSDIIWLKIVGNEQNPFENIFSELKISMARATKNNCHSTCGIFWPDLHAAALLLVTLHWLFL